MSKRISILLVLMVAVSFALVACGGSAAPAASNAAPAASSQGAVPKPAPQPNSKAVDKNATWDKIAGDAAKALGFSNYVYEAWELPATNTWDDTFKYYSDQMAAAGWSGQGTVQDFEGGKVGAFVHADTKTGLVIFYLASPDGTKSAYDLAIFGNQRLMNDSAPLAGNSCNPLAGLTLSSDRVKQTPTTVVQASNDTIFHPNKVKAPVWTYNTYAMVGLAKRQPIPAQLFAFEK